MQPIASQARTKWFFFVPLVVFIAYPQLAGAWAVVSGANREPSILDWVTDPAAGLPLTAASRIAIAV
jgi:hypothetical protein